MKDTLRTLAAAGSRPSVRSAGRLLALALLVVAIPNLAAALEPKFMFMHHSVGRYLVERGDVIDLMAARLPGSEFVYMMDTDTGSNSVEAIYDFWTGDSAHKQTLLAMSDIIAFKSCYTAGEIVIDETTIQQYKDWYTGIIGALNAIPEHRFVMLGYVPLRDEGTTPAQAALNWEFHQWLALQARGNVSFWNYYAQMMGADLYLIDEYESTIYVADNHPNAASDAVMGSVFVDYLIAVYQDNPLSGVPDEADDASTWGMVKARFR